MARALESNRTPLGVRCLRACQWAAVIVVPVVVGGLVGGSLGGIVTAALLIPSFHHLLSRGDRAWAERSSSRASVPILARRRAQPPAVDPRRRDRQESGV